MSRVAWRWSKLTSFPRCFESAREQGHWERWVSSATAESFGFAQLSRVLCPIFANPSKQGTTRPHPHRVNLPGARQKRRAVQLVQCHFLQRVVLALQGEGVTRAKCLFAFSFQRFQRIRSDERCLQIGWLFASSGERDFTVIYPLHLAFQ